jgi:branched-subunit amino acid transport protein AzlD
VDEERARRRFVIIASIIIVMVILCILRAEDYLAFKRDNPSYHVVREVEE